MKFKVKIIITGKFKESGFKDLEAEYLKRLKRFGSVEIIELDEYGYKKESDIELAKQFIQTRLENNESVIFVAVGSEQTKPVGFTQLYPTYSSVRVVKNWILNDLYVDKEYRKQGIGEKLIAAAMNFAKENNAKFVQLSTAVDTLHKVFMSELALKSRNRKQIFTLIQ